MRPLSYFGSVPRLDGCSANVSCKIQNQKNEDKVGLLGLQIASTKILSTSVAKVPNDDLDGE